MKRSFFQAAVTSILLYGCTTWTLTKRLEKKLDGNYTRMLRAILNKSWRQHLTRHQLYDHLPPITKTIQVRRTRHAGHCWRSRDELIRDVLLWTPTHGRAKAGRPARTYIQQLWEDTGCCHEDQPRAMNDREEWRERVRDIRATSAIWWWWSLCRFNRWVFVGLRDFRPFFIISLLIFRLCTLHLDERKASCTSSRVTIRFWLMSHLNFLDNLGEIFLRAPVLFVFVFNSVTSLKHCNEWTYRSKRNIPVAWDISITFSSFPKLNNQCFFVNYSILYL